MTIVQDMNENNVVFIENSICKNNFFKVSYREDGTDIIKKDESCFTVKLVNENISVNSVYQIFYNKNANKIVLFTKGYEMSIIKDILVNEIVDIDYDHEEPCINIEVCELPRFLSENNFTNTYPKFEVKVSDCVYSMKIFTSDTEYIDIPQYQSHLTMNSTLNHISDVVFYMTEGNPTFIDQLSNCSQMFITVVAEDNSTKGNTYKYKLSENGICLFGKEFDNGFYVVEWQKFFKLIIDRTWIVEFE